MAHWLKSCSWIFFSPLPSLCDCWCHSRAILRECCWNVSVKRLARSHYSKLFKLGLRKGLIFIQSTEKEWVCWGRCREIVPVETWKEKLIFPLIQPLETMETLMEGGMAVFRNGGVACRSTITFHSGSLRDGIHYTVARETDGNRGEEKTHMEIGRHEQRGEKKKRKFHLAVKVITGGNLHAPVWEWSRCSVLSFVFFSPLEVSKSSKPKSFLPSDGFIPKPLCTPNCRWKNTRAMLKVTHVYMYSIFSM